MSAENRKSQIDIVTPIACGDIISAVPPGASASSPLIYPDAPINSSLIGEKRPMDIEIMGEGFLFPEGPIAFPDGSIVFVEILRGTLTRLWGDGRSEVVAQLGGGPNGAALGPDGAVYVCNNGGFEWSRDENGRIIVIGTTPADYEGGRIERVDLATGKVDRIYSHCGEQMLRGPNDLVFDRTGGFWFTDLGKNDHATRDLSALYYAKPDGSQISKAVHGALSFNGAGLSPDETVLHVADTLSARLWSYDLRGPGALKPAEGRHNPGRLLATVPGDVWVDSLAVTAAGNVCVATLPMAGSPRCARMVQPPTPRCPNPMSPTSASAGRICAPPTSPSPPPVALLACVGPNRDCGLISTPTDACSPKQACNRRY
jgi:gluconolactonase